MDNEYDPEDERITESAWSKGWEDQYLEEFAAERDTMEQQAKIEQEAIVQKLWLSFQSSATSLTNLYKEKIQGHSSWQPFQHSAGEVTILYKDAVESQRRNYELGMQNGANRKIRDIVTWAKKRRRHIRRDELIAFLCGKAPPTKPQRLSPPRSRCGSRSHSERSSPLTSTATFSESEAIPDLTAFQNALAIQGLNGAMSNVSMGFQSDTAQTRSDELHGLIMEGLARHNESRKRASTFDANMDSPTRKRNKHL